MSYAYLKIVHLLALVLWLGPAIGAYWLILRLEHALTPDNRLLIEKHYEFVQRIEHIAFLIMIVTGFAMIQQIGLAYLKVDWLLAKLYLVGGIVVIELLDVYISHYLYRKVAKKSQDITSREWVRFLSHRKLFYLITVPILFVLAVCIFYLAVVKSYQPLPSPFKI